MPKPVAKAAYSLPYLNRKVIIPNRYVEDDQVEYELKPAIRKGHLIEIAIINIKLSETGKYFYLDFKSFLPSYI